MKTTSYAAALVSLGEMETLRIMCTREFQNSMEDSVKPEIEMAIVELGLDWFYTIQDQRITGLNGTIFRFKGLERNVMSLKGWAKFDIVWVEEANTMSKKSVEILFPTMRKAGSEVWLSFNRHKRSDPVDKLFLGKDGPPARSLVVKVGWRDNKWWPKELEEERQRTLTTDPDRYAHIWEGEPDDDPGGKVVLKYGDLRRCVDAHMVLGYEPAGMTHGALDPADAQDGDNNGFALRKGSLLYHFEDWKEPHLYKTANRAHRRLVEHGASRVYYDASGLGAGVKSDFARMREGVRGAPPFTTKPFLFGGAVNGKERKYLKGVKNKDFFARQNSQAWWNLRLRMQNTMAALRGDSVNLDYCLFIDSAGGEVDRLLLELSQCIYDYDRANRLTVDKQPDDRPSPNMADSVVMAFAADIRKGLRA